MRADAGFYAHTVVAACRGAGARFSISAPIEVDEVIERPESLAVRAVWSGVGPLIEQGPGCPMSGARRAGP